jgi:hypothetical protein
MLNKIYYRRILFLILVVFMTFAVSVFLRWGNDTGTTDFRYEVALPRSQADDDIDVIAHNLVDQWFRHFNSSGVGWKTRLQDYRIDRVDVTRTQDQVIVSVTSQVRPTQWSFDNWLAGSGGTILDGWIHGKFLQFALVITQEEYKLYEVGTGTI